jgi:hypothetical protein
VGLITCEDCGRKISDQAAACPQCGRPMKLVPVVAATPRVEKVVEVKEGLFLQSLNAGCGCLLFLLALMVVLFLVFSTK